MSQFYGSLTGNRGMATRQGTKASGIEGHIRGWHIGARVICFHDGDSGKDTVQVYKTGGSSNPSGQELIAEFTEDQEKKSRGLK